ncbi:hypothetical protein FHX08_001302 [Rhizobium sp. BK529]|nr:twin-arginine translocation signal domain-containing protein [Rhizobium sp. BK529]MBB3590958.1 hypothetical protein [Rhizobium sp. BK529]
MDRRDFLNGLTVGAAALGLSAALRPRAGGTSACR